MFSQYTIFLKRQFSEQLNRWHVERGSLAIQLVKSGCRKQFTNGEKQHFSTNALSSEFGIDCVPKLGRTIARVNIKVDETTDRLIYFIYEK